MQLRVNKTKQVAGDEEQKGITKLARKLTSEQGSSAKKPGSAKAALHSSLDKCPEKHGNGRQGSKIGSQALKRNEKDGPSADTAHKSNVPASAKCSTDKKLKAAMAGECITPKAIPTIFDHCGDESLKNITVIHEIEDEEEEFDNLLDQNEILHHHAPPAFVTKTNAGKDICATVNTAGQEEKKANVVMTPREKAPALLCNIPVFKRNQSPLGEDAEDLVGVDLDIPDILLNEDCKGPKSEVTSKEASLPVTTDNSSGYPSGISTESPIAPFKAEKINLQSFIAHKLLGKGSFGEVYLVEKLSTKTLYAMKVLSKAKILSQNLVKYAITERKVLSAVNHPFIVKLHFAFQSSSKLFLVLDYCAGGDLSEYLKREKKFTEERAKIYTAEILLALEYLHKKDIIFRDLKPDNVVLDSEGHSLLTDFGLSKEGIYDNQGAKSFCGSLAYLAPEMIKRTGHGKSVDWYLLGVLLYEMLVGVPPYYSVNKDELFYNIQKGILKIPSTMSEEARGLILGLLNRNPNKRLGAGPLDAEEIKKEAWFKGVNWDDVCKKKLKPPRPLVRALNGAREMPKTMDSVSSGSAAEKIEGWSFINLRDSSL